MGTTAFGLNFGETFGCMRLVRSRLLAERGSFVAADREGRASALALQELVLELFPGVDIEFLVD